MPPEPQRRWSWTHGGLATPGTRTQESCSSPPQEHKEVTAGSMAFMLGMVPTVTHTLPAWSIPDIRNSIPTPSPALSVLILRSLTTCWGPGCLLSLPDPLENPCGSLCPGPLQGGQSDAPPAPLVVPLSASDPDPVPAQTLQDSMPCISSNNPGPFHLSIACKPRGSSPLEATTQTRAGGGGRCVCHPAPVEKLSARTLTPSPASLPLLTHSLLRGIGPGTPDAHTSRITGSR